MKVIAVRGEQQMIVEDGFKGTDGPCVIQDTITGKEFKSTVQAALKWGYWQEPEGQSKESLQAIVTVQIK